jgi:hypothetical protein
MDGKLMPKPPSETDVEEALVQHFSSQHWADFIKGLEAGPHVRHAHAYCQSSMDPRAMALFLTAYFHRFDRPLQRRIKILPVTDDFLDVYNVHPKGHPHWEMFLNWTPGTLLKPQEAYGARGAHAIEFWDDAYMDAYYGQFRFRDIDAPERKDCDDYFSSPAWVNNLLINIDDFGGVIHSHALVECSLHPEQLVKIGAEYIERRGWRIAKHLSIVFNVYGMDIGKLTYLLRKPEIVIELEWHYNPEVAIKAATIPHFRVATAARLNDLIHVRPYVSFGREVIDRVLKRLTYPG